MAAINSIASTFVDPNGSTLPISDQSHTEEQHRVTAAATRALSTEPPILAK